MVHSFAGIKRASMMLFQLLASAFIIFGFALREYA